MNDLNTELLAPLGALLGAIGAVGQLLMPWLRDRSQSAKERKRIEFAKLEVDFISAWMAAASAFSGDDIDAKKTEAKKRLALLLAPSEIDPAMSLQQSNEPRAGILVSIAFYSYLGFFLVLVLGASVDKPTNELSIKALFTESNMTMLLIVAVPQAILFYLRRRSKIMNSRKVVQHNE
ncbi:MAG: hypothetical protein Q8L92_16490 [Rubrivivax sp.]|nr:hypothetical protein [Rubrivivax sp.]